MIVIALPNYGSFHPSLLPSIITATRKYPTAIVQERRSLLANCFNRCWAVALNSRGKGVTEFAMHHSDISAEPHWLDTLMEEKERVGADVISAVVPINDDRGLTSTGWIEDGVIRRLTMRQIASLPTTFGAADLGHPIAVNTGLWVCDFTKEWVERVHFQINDSITKEPDGTFVARVLSEDWNFSAWCAKEGLKVFATTAVKLTHHGQREYRNEGAWGTLEQDQGDELNLSI